MMTGASRNHARIVRNLVFLLSGQLDPQWEAIAEFGLDAGPRTLRYPDILVDRANAAGGDYRATQPLLAVEVLSPTSEAIDLGDKAAEYIHLPTLQAYLVFAQDTAKAWLWLRAAGDLLEGPIAFSGLDQHVVVPALALDLLLSDVYRNVL
jgi:Uma2 family endonuclease